MYKLKISPEDKNDLAEIKGYIFQELCNSQAAVGMVNLGREIPLFQVERQMARSRQGWLTGPVRPLFP